LGHHPSPKTGIRQVHIRVGSIARENLIKPEKDWKAPVSRGKRKGFEKVRG
jgi:hypothetical protein